MEINVCVEFAFGEGCSFTVAEGSPAEVTEQIKKQSSNGLSELLDNKGIFIISCYGDISFRYNNDIHKVSEIEEKIFELSVIGTIDNELFRPSKDVREELLKISNQDELAYEYKVCKEIERSEELVNELKKQQEQFGYLQDIYLVTAGYRNVNVVVGLENAEEKYEYFCEEIEYDYDREDYPYKQPDVVTMNRACINDCGEIQYGELVKRSVFD